MNHHIKYYGLLLMLACIQGFSAPIAEKINFWQCTTHDNANQQWTARNIYQKMALNIAFAECKKGSQTPASCKASKEDCEEFNQGMSIKPEWRCTALDQTAEPWQSNFYRHRDDAALAAQAYCKEKSVVPDTCYINLVTCVNLNAREQM
ncbi:hypothetical protein [Legionella fallonii]|uniref:Uncharacterized protein n=1 Tax=Legionella fallonii LLAP-10 TaxID=1212491 RepID=A0A098G4D7_9GAMM|nr:hypothetical protein [Legionella fallonii]CEG56836.1 conserved protein of unknown function [Legionella fallonii LLAP-10]